LILIADISYQNLVVVVWKCFQRFFQAAFFPSQQNTIVLCGCQFLGDCFADTASGTADEVGF